MRNGAEQPVSVVIPVYDDYHRLQECLSALEHQTFPSDRYEVIVVDNGTPDHAFVDVSARFAHVEMAFESEPGSYAARNAGIEKANGELLAFTDADCLPDEQWLEEGIGRLRADKSIGLVGGAIELFAGSDHGPTPAERWELRRGFPQRKYVERFHFAATANMFARRRVFEEVGAFNHDLKSGGDREWGERVADAGFRQVFESRARVRHPARATLRALLQKTVRTTRGDYRRREQSGEFDPIRRLRRMLWAVGDLATAPLRLGLSAAADSGSPRERVEFAAVDELVRMTREIVALEQLGSAIFR